jgi:hypothetical protein
MDQVELQINRLLVAPLTVTLAVMVLVQVPQLVVVALDQLVVILLVPWAVQAVAAPQLLARGALQQVQVLTLAVQDILQAVQQVMARVDVPQLQQVVQRGLMLDIQTQATAVAVTQAHPRAVQAL